MSPPHDFASAAAEGHLRIVEILAPTLMRLTRSPGTEPFWGKSKAYRFDDPSQIYGVTYAAPTLDVAFAETVLHQKACFIGGQWVINQSDINERRIVTFEPPGDPLLRLADLTGISLKALGLNNDLCSSDDYADSMHVSLALHEQMPGLDGIMYVSRQLNRGQAVALFERSAVRVASKVVPLLDHPQFSALLDAFNVAIVPHGRAPT